MKKISIQKNFPDSEERFCRIYEHIRIPFLILNEGGNIVSVNPAWEKRIGRKKTEVVGTSFFDILPAADADKLRSYLSTQQTSEPPPDIELNVCCKDGSLARVLFNSFPETGLVSGNGNSFCTLHDIPLKLSAHDSLLKAQQLEFTATLAGGIAHDFNNLLMSIMGNISLAQLFLNPEDKAVKILQRAESTCNEGKELTQQFIILSKCGYPSKKPSSILKLLKDASVLENPNPKIEVVLDLPNGYWKIDVDEYQIKYVLSHLMNNAVESMPNGGTVHISIQNIVSSGKPPLPDHPIASGCFLNIRITDQGKGIPSEHLPRIFDPYYTTKEMGPQKGMGLGLTTVYSIVHKHDGFIFIESEVDQGTTVNIYLPALPA
jgi:PAS domain S-box-containing protein